MRAKAGIYSTDLAHVHDVGFGAYARAAAPELAAILREHAVSSNRHVVEIGCGGGTVARYLGDSGYQVFGIDISPAMIRIARRRAPACTFRVGSWMDVTVPPCAAVIAIGEVVTYMRGGHDGRSVREHDASLTAFFGRVFTGLHPGGLLLFDFMESAERRTFRARRVDRDNWSLVCDAALDGSGRVLTRRMSIRRTLAGQTRRSTETHHVRVYTRTEMAAALRRSGFTMAMGRRIGAVRLIAGDCFVVARKPHRADER